MQKNSHVTTSAEKISARQQLNTSGMFCISNDSLALGRSDFSDRETTFVSNSASRVGRPMVMIRSQCSRGLSVTCADV